MIEPITFRILVKPVDVLDKEYKTSIPGFQVAGTEKDRHQAGVDEGTVVSMGPTAFADYKVDNPLKVGDTIVFAKFAGKPVVDPEDRSTKYVLINDEDVVAIIKNGV